VSESGSAIPVSTTTQSTTTSQEQGSTSNLPKNGAPNVSDPLNVSALADDPCEAMTNEQAKGFAETFLGETISSGNCRWKYQGEHYRIGYVGGGIESGNYVGLTKYYGPIDEEVMEVNPVDSVHGYPAVHADLELDTAGQCLLKVGLRNDVVYDALANLESEHPEYDDPCGVAREFAGVVVDNLKEAQ